MTYTSSNHSLPKYLLFGKKKKSSNISLIVRGQGVFIFEYNQGSGEGSSIKSKDTSSYAGRQCLLFMYDKEKNFGIKVEFTQSAVVVKELPSNKIFKDEKNTKGLCNIEGAYYWISIDSQNQTLQAGVGEARIETAIYTYQFPKEYKKSLESLMTIEYDEKHCSIEPMRLLRDPITQKVPLIIKGTDSLTMHTISNSKFLPKANLSAISQILHDCISGKKFILNDKDFPDFSKAIERSIATPGLWCNKRLQEKASEFGKPNIKETYLRITLGQNNGESPGIPYVMEIWPVGHYSPIHNHGGASAIIRVLRGNIHVKLFPFLSKDANNEFGTADFKKGNITWISPTLNQVHQLHNLDTNKKTCITVQCYMYETDDTAHYDYFDYIDDETGKIQQYEPDSDMDFISFKQLMKEEWNSRPSMWKFPKVGDWFRLLRTFKMGTCR